MRGGDALIVATLAAAAADWIAVARDARRAEYILKPLTTIMLIGAAGAFRVDAPTASWDFTLLALLLSLAGDVLLMLPADPFLAGLVAFLLAHLAYIAAFNPTPPPPGMAVLGVGIVGAVAGALFVRIRGGMVRAGRGSLVPPVGAYVVVVSGMVVSAIATLGRPTWTMGRSAVAIVAASLFFASDAMIGWTRFVGPIRRSRVTITVTYHLAQVGLVVALLGYGRSGPRG